MNSRDVRVSLYGVVVGVILGAGVLAFAQNSALSASVTDLAKIRAGAASSMSDYTRRAIDKKGVPLREDSETNSYPTFKERYNQASSSSAMPAPATMCDAVLMAIAKIQKTYNSVVPNTLKNTELRMRMDAAFADASDDYCTAAAPVVPMSSSSAAAKINNHCETYPRHTVRYTQCVLAEQYGKTYP